MFRRSFLRHHGLAFPEGRRRLEDQLFVIEAYFRSPGRVGPERYPCYFYMKRDDGANAGSVRLDPPGYYANLREVLDVVVRETPPGPFRDRLLRRFYRGEMLGRLRNSWYLSQEPQYQDLLFRTIRELAIARMGEDVEAGLPLLPRLRSRLLRGDDPSAMRELARRTSQLEVSARIRSVDWVAGTMRLSFEAEATVGPGGDPVTLVRRGGRLHPRSCPDRRPRRRSSGRDRRRLRQPSDDLGAPPHEPCQVGPPDENDGPPGAGWRRG